jgi:hypothetical protein
MHLIRLYALEALRLHVASVSSLQDLLCMPLAARSCSAVNTTHVRQKQIIACLSWPQNVLEY